MKILLIDDRSDILKIGKASLELRGAHQVATASSCDEGLELARATLPDLILLDVMMPGQDGLSTLQQMRADPVLGRVPVIFMTAKVQPQEIQQYRQAGALGVIPKPFDPMTLAAAVEKLMQPPPPVAGA